MSPQGTIHSRHQAAGLYPPTVRLRPPRTLITAIERPYLHSLVLNGLERQVVVLQAPAGFGKTEQLASVYRACERLEDIVSGWLTLSAIHCDPAILMADLSMVLGCRSTVSDLDGLFDELTTRPSRTVLFLDGIEDLGRLPAGSCLDRLLRNPPDNLRIAIATNGRFPLPLARLNLRGLVTTIDADQLAFTRSEIRRIVGRTIATAELEAVHDLTGGWPALVQLIAERVRNDGTVSPSTLREVCRLAVGDYIEQVVLADLPASLRDSLPACAVLDQFNIELAHVLSGNSLDPDDLRGQDPIVSVVAIGDRAPGWYQMHPAVKAHLIAQLIARSSDGVALLNRRAASWFAGCGALEKAVSHAARGGDFALAAETIRGAGGVTLFIRAGHTVLDRLINDLPVDVINRSPSLSLCYALVLAKRGRIAASRSTIERLKQADMTDGAEFAAIPGSTLAHIESLIDVYEDSHLEDAEIERFESTVGGFGPECTWERGWLYNHLCIAYTRRGDLELARLSAVKALACYRDEGAAYSQIFMLIHLGLVNILTGSFSAALAFARDAQDLIQRTQWSDENLRAIANIPLAEVLYQQGDLALAERLLDESVAPMCNGEGWVDIYIRLFAVLARCRMRACGLDAAIAVVDRAEEVAIDRKLPRLQLGANILRVELFAKAGMLESAEHLAREVAIELDDRTSGKSSTWRERNAFLLARARLRFAQDRSEEANADLRQIFDNADGNGCGYDKLFASILSTEVAWALGQHADALVHLQAAIALARPHEFTQAFIDAGPAFTATLRLIVRRFGLNRFSADAVDFISRIVGHSVHRPQRRAVAESDSKNKHWRTMEGLLSQREREVLALLSNGQSNKEIARALDLSEATVKFHLKNLFAKLGVSRRAMALSVAKRLNLQ
jgi:LuxR family maltose regulon positive regulatory protein